ncbi:Metacaspase-1 [Seminavis robusta]|uniref:Metacaspase-1 n=1 Tax=Seminavis robusta TaxID=568900 RepID=A0A9N8HDD8_9STRA|nr:Metacaspase-1 [Seminavis robusta]|eukprot:Sro339_g121010.1 Metacaspase-1 (438) ;mRNA; r:18839-20561
MTDQDIEEKAKEVIAADVRLFSGCEDAQTSGDMTDVANFNLPDPAGRAGGACTSGLLQVLYADHKDTSYELSFEDVLLKLRESLDGIGLSQVPQLSTSHNLDMQQPFHIVPEGSTGTRRAVMIGINYKGEGKLSGCCNDVKNMKEYIMDVHGFQEENITLLLDEKPQYTRPTRQNITRALKKMVQVSEPGDVVFIHFSGHGGKVKDFDGDEEDGFDETLIPVDFKRSGHIRDDYLFRNLVCPMKGGVTMTCLFDCCHSGTVLDLPFVFIGDGKQEGMGIQLDFEFGTIEQAAAAEPEEIEEYYTEEEIDSDEDDDEVVNEDDVPSDRPVARVDDETNLTATTQQNTDNPPEPVAEPSGEMQQINVRFRHRSFVINADVHDKFSEIRKSLEETTGVAVDDQRLTYNGLGITFKDEKSLSYYGCAPGGFFTLEEKKQAK